MIHKCGLWKILVVVMAGIILLIFLVIGILICVGIISCKCCLKGKGEFITSSYYINSAVVIHYCLI